MKPDLFGSVGGIAAEDSQPRDENDLEQVWQDVRYGARMLKEPWPDGGRLVIAGIRHGANTAIFSIIRRAQSQMNAARLLYYQRGGR